MCFIWGIMLFLHSNFFISSAITQASKIWSLGNKLKQSSIIAQIIFVSLSMIRNTNYYYCSTATTALVDRKPKLVGEHEVCKWWASWRRLVLIPESKEHEALCPELLQLLLRERRRVARGRKHACLPLFSATEASVSGCLLLLGYNPYVIVVKIAISTWFV
jgi:hypothetical protein